MPDIDMKCVDSEVEIATHGTPQTSESCRGRVLVVDDEPDARALVSELLERHGYVTRRPADGEEALAVLDDFDPDVVVADLAMPKLDGIRLLEHGRPRVPHASFVLMTGVGSIETAVEAIKKGAEDYLTKPVSCDVVRDVVHRCTARAHAAREAPGRRAAVRPGDAFRPRILGDHPSMRRLLETVARVGPARTTVLVEGESGTGKELVANAVHQSSARRDGPFVSVNCAALAETLLESELFGHERGAFTGASRRHRGKLEQAHGGTLFLDEVSEIPLAVQVKLLRFLQERKIERVGGDETLELDVRVIAATNRNLKKQVDEGTFREDLYYRLDVVRLAVPPLRARRSDIPLLAHHFLRKLADENGKDIGGFSDEAMRYLRSYPWPGNVRELENAVERAVVMSEGALIQLDDLPSGSDDGTHAALVAPGCTLEEIERTAILQTLEAVGGSTQRAADVLGISRRKIQYRLKSWGLRSSELGDGPWRSGTP